MPLRTYLKLQNPKESEFTYLQFQYLLYESYVYMNISTFIYN